MDKDIDNRIRRVEKALANLVDSLSKFNPSVPATSDLAEAEKELSQGLHHVEEHQNNVVRLGQLRAATETLDEQIKYHLVSLTASRKALLEAPETKISPNPKNSFSYDELLDYARLISNTTLPFEGASLEGLGLDKKGNPLKPPEAPAGTAIAEPSAGVKVGPTPAAPPANSQTSAGKSTSTPTPIPTPTPTTNNPNPPQGTTKPAQGNSQPFLSSGDTLLGGGMSNIGVAQTTASAGQRLGDRVPKLPEFLFRAANPRHNAVFWPFPSQERMMSGSLVANARLVRMGVNPRGFDPVVDARRQEELVRQAAEDDERRRVEAEEKIAQQRRDREAEMRRRRDEAAARARELERLRLERERKEREELRLMMGLSAQNGSADASGAKPGATPKGEFMFMDDFDDDDD